MQRFDMAVTPRSDFEPDDYRAATNLAILYVALLLDRLVYQNTYGFTAIWTIDVRFQQKSHGLLRQNNSLNSDD